MSTEYLVVLPVNAMSWGDRYREEVSLPLHCTVMPWFQFYSEYDFEHFRIWLNALVNQKPIELVSEFPAMFGPDNTVPVHVLERNPALELLHTQIFLHLAQARATPSELRWVGAGYRPHVTTVRENQFLPGTRHIAKTIAIVERGKDERGMKKVVAAYGFKD